MGPTHPELANWLNNLANLYTDQGKYVEAEQLFQRALLIKENMLGPVHPSVAISLESYASLLRKTKRKAEAAKLEARAKAIRATHAQQNSPDSKV